MKPVPSIAIFGANGQLGHALERVAEQQGMSIICFDRESADITQSSLVAAALERAGQSLVINAAAYTAVDRAESEQDKAFAINRDGARILAEACATIGLPFMHISTDYVFDGTKPTPYVETDPVSPVSAYGRSKEAGERAVLEACPHAMVFRTAWVYGIEGANFVKTMLRLGNEREIIKVVNDQRGCPTFADDLAIAILTIARKYQPGLYHLAASGEATWYDFAREIFAGRERPCVEPITTAEYPTPARRPANSILDSSRAKREFNVELPHWKDGLLRMLSALK